MQAIQESAQYYYVNNIKPVITNPFFMSIYNVLSVISLKIVLITTTIYEFSKYYIPIAYNLVYDFCSKYIPEVYQFLYAFIEALNNNYGDDDNNNVNETNISSPKKPIIDSSWCNVDVKNIISDSDEITNNDQDNDGENNVNDDDGSTLPRPTPGVWDDDAADVNDVNTNDELNDENNQDDQSEEDKKNQ
jgi:hypothetical protein